MNLPSSASAAYLCIPVFYTWDTNTTRNPKVLLPGEPLLPCSNQSNKFELLLVSCLHPCRCCYPPEQHCHTCCAQSQLAFMAVVLSALWMNHGFCESACGTGQVCYESLILKVEPVHGTDTAVIVSVIPSE